LGDFFLVAVVLMVIEMLPSAVIILLRVLCMYGGEDNVLYHYALQ